MIIDAGDISQYRPIAANIDLERVRIYIREAQTLDILPAIGAEEFERLNDERLQEKDYSPEELLLLKGGTYTDKGGCLRHFEGLKAALAYLSYARFIRNHQLNVTPFGVVVKEGDESSPLDVRAVAAASKDAERIGQAYLADCVAFWKGSCCCAEKKVAHRRRFIAIGD